MRRVIVYFEWKTRWWLNQKADSSREPTEHQIGYIAYTNKQAKNLENLSKQFLEIWNPILGNKALPNVSGAQLRTLLDIEEQYNR